MRKNYDLPAYLFGNNEYLVSHWAEPYPVLGAWGSARETIPLVPKYHYIFHFSNGYGASVIKGPGTYGYEEDLWELGVLSEQDGEWHLCYDTEITDDVEGYLTVDDVKKLLDEIKGLEAKS